MADTDQIAIVRLGPEDATAGLALSTEAHWNQNEADWRFFLTKGTVFGARDDEGRLIATRGAAALYFGQRLDQHGAGDAQAGAAAVSPPNWSTRVSRPPPSRVSRPGSTRRRRAPTYMARLDLLRRLQLRRLRLDHAISTKAEAPPSLSPSTSRNSPRGIASPWASTAPSC